MHQAVLATGRDDVVDLRGLPCTTAVRTAVDLLRYRPPQMGLAVTDARRGDSLRVMNPTSKREAVGKVEASGIVRVPFRGAGSDQ